MDQVNDLLQSLNNEEKINLPKPLAPMIIDERYKEKNKRMRKELNRKIKCEKTLRHRVKKLERLLEKQKSKYKSKNSRNLSVDERVVMDENILEVKYSNLSQNDEKCKIEVTNDLTRRVGDARQKFRSVKLQFKIDVVMERN